METQIATPEVVYKKVKAPLSTEEMKEAFLNKGKIKYVIDYKNSSLKTDVLLMFLSNLEIDPEFDLEGVSSQEKFDFITTYMKSKALINSRSLLCVVTNILLTYRGYDWQKYFLRGALSDEEIQQFIAQNKELVEKWAMFLDSTLLLLIRAFDPGISLDEYEEVPETTIGVNVLNLIQTPAFYDAFIGTASGKQVTLKWFTNLFETPYFKGKMLINYFGDKHPMYVGINALANGFITPAILDDVAKELDVLEKQKQ